MHFPTRKGVGTWYLVTYTQLLSRDSAPLLNPNLSLGIRTYTRHPAPRTRHPAPRTKITVPTREKLDSTNIDGANGRRYSLLSANASV